MDFDLKTVGLIASILYSVGCELLNFSPSLKSNSVLQLVIDTLGFLGGGKR